MKSSIVERFHRFLATRVKCGGERRKETETENERAKERKKEKFVRARVPCGHPWGSHSTGGSTRPLIPSFIHTARDLNR